MNSYDLFIEVVELKSFSSAAKKLLLSPSTVSKQMAHLEQQLGVQLFNRTTRVLSTTRAGELYYLRCKDISQRMDDAKAELKDLANSASGKLIITWPSVLSSSSIVDVLGAFCRTHPDIMVRANVSTDLLNLAEDRIDFAFRVAELEDSSMVAFKLATIQPLVCATPDFVERHGVPTSIPDLMRLPHIVPTYYNLAQKLRAYDPEFSHLDLQAHHETNDIHALHRLALQGLGAAFVFEHLVRTDLESGRLIDLTRQKRLPPRPVYLVYPKLHYMPHTMRLFIDHFKTAFR
jgi:DNA-binding transcriptional LysR family regulator